MKKFALVLAIIGALNWGCIGIFGMDLLGSIFGGTYQIISRVIYTVVGLAGIYLIPSLMSDNEK